MAYSGSIYIVGSAFLKFSNATTVTQETHMYSNEVVTQTLEDGSPLSDHIVILPDELEVILFVSNSVWLASNEVYAKLKSMRNKRELCLVLTEHEIYKNMAIESVSAPHEAPYVGVLQITVKFKKVDYTGKSVASNSKKKFEKGKSDGGGKDASQTSTQSTDMGELSPSTVV